MLIDVYLPKAETQLNNSCEDPMNENERTIEVDGKSLLSAHCPCSAAVSHIRDIYYIYTRVLGFDIANLCLSYQRSCQFRIKANGSKELRIVFVCHKQTSFNGSSLSLSHVKHQK